MKLGPQHGKTGAENLVRQWEFNASRKHPGEKLKDFRKECLDGIDKMHLKGHAKDLMKNAVNEVLPKSMDGYTLAEALQV